MFPGHKFSYPYAPGQPGHEATGEIAALGEGVSGFAVGDRVCTWRDGGHERPGCYAQFVLMRAENVIRVPEHLAPQSLAPLELAMCVGASFLVLSQMDILRGRRVGVMGLGPAGLIALQMARSEGAAQVLGFDLSQERRARAVELGADAAYDPRTAAPALFPARPNQPSLDTIIDCVGAKSSVEWAMDHASDTVALFGVQREDYIFAPRHYHPGLRLCGYPGHSRAAAEYALDLIARGVLDLAPLVTHHFALEQYDQAIDLLERQQAIKVCFWPWKTPESPIPLGAS
jgi:threonine dehydrogenase-like Zn-dependent dehydrogenase